MERHRPEWSYSNVFLKLLQIKHTNAGCHSNMIIILDNYCEHKLRFSYLNLCHIFSYIHILLTTAIYYDMTVIAYY